MISRWNSTEGRHLRLTDKGGLKWYGSFESLETMMNELLKQPTKWSSPGGGSKLLDMDELVIRWYSQNNSLTVKGEASEDMKTQLCATGRRDTEVEANGITPDNYALEEDEAINDNSEDTNTSNVEPDEPDALSQD